jgi:hypothetical protein
VRVSSKLSCSSLVDNDHTTFDNDFGSQHVPVTFERITVEKDDVGEFAGSNVPS